MVFYTPLQLGPQQHMTPDGFLLCVGVPIARTGEQTYVVGELPLAVEPGADGLIRVVRLDSEVFRPETLASFEGKPVTLDHPAAGVTPANARKLTVGHAQNVRRGEAGDADLLIADLLITDEAAIKAIRIDRDPVTNVPVKPLREVSCGYDAEYAQDTPGVAYQRNIIGNHIALVERGRAGSRCSIQDKESLTMKKDLLARILAAFKTNDSTQIAEAVADAEKETETPEQAAEREAAAKATADAEAVAAAAAQGDRVDKLQACVDQILALLQPAAAAEPAAGDAPAETPEAKAEREAAEAAAAAAKTGDAAKVADAMRDVAVRAEILAPGFAMPTADAEATLDTVATVQRAVLARVVATDTGKSLVAPLIGGQTLDAMGADMLNLVFVSASEMAKLKNNGAAPGRASVQSFGKVQSIAEINEANSKFYQ